MISVAQALDHLFALVEPLPGETVPLRAAAGRRLMAPVTAQRTQPPFPVSAMYGYAVKSAEVEQHALFKVIGESAAGHGFDGAIKAGQAVRIFTAAPVPEGADCVIIQKDVERKGDMITIIADQISTGNIRPAGNDFKAGDSFAPDHPLNPQDIALLAAMNQGSVTVRRKPVVALIPTGDELVQPGEAPGDDQILASNSYGLAAMLEAHGATARMIPIARDTPESLRMAFSLAQGADLIVTIGGASVGDHDLVGGVAAELGMDQSFYKIAMRPGKPLMAGTLGSTPMVGLPGNPVSAMVCGTVFVLPMVRVMLGQPAKASPRATAPLNHNIPANGPREHYMRADLKDGGLQVFERQDSALLTILASANALAVRPPHDPARNAGETLEFILL